MPPISILPCLRSVTAIAEYLIPFLESWNKGNFPSLQHLGIHASRAPVNYETHQFELHPVYELVLEGHPLNSICVDNIANSGIIEWIIATSERWLLGNPFTQLQKITFDHVHTMSKASFDKLLGWLTGICSAEDDLDPTDYTFLNCRLAVQRLIKQKIPNIQTLDIQPSTDNNASEWHPVALLYHFELFGQGWDMGQGGRNVNHGHIHWDMGHVSKYTYAPQCWGPSDPGDFSTGHLEARTEAETFKKVVQLNVDRDKELGGSAVNKQIGFGVTSS
ncbi:hypothetical protein BDN70DRAFT_917832 [Pholiota conissans]|uniref:Uncharacterized protein n=1 Tax=Pholiota conissans TaxID=109636 RepID=A0A9P5ZBD2_9AGAR|nr:hypothetical protein BDN70DRAFT_917832 [Pholiota conissans]